MLLNEKYKITGSQIATGITSINWPGRIQEIESGQVFKLTNRRNVRIFLDGAHNDSGAQCFANWIGDNLTGYNALILGMTKNRNANSFCSHFKSKVNKGVAVTVRSEPSSYSATMLCHEAKKSGIEFTTSDSLEDAIKLICMEIEEKNVNIIITGSLFLIADFMKLVQS